MSTRPAALLALGLALAAAVRAAGDDLATATKGCEAGRTADCRRLGLAHRHGRGVRKQMAYAMASFRKACDGGDAAGCTYLADHHALGLGVPKDKALAASLYERGCEGGDPFACMQSAFLVPTSDGNGLRMGALLVRAAALARPACDAGQLVAGPSGDTSACSLLGGMHSQGWGAPKDEARAAVLLEKACAGGDPSGCYLLVDSYKSGKAVLKDIDRVAALFEKGCDATAETDGCDALQELGKMSLAGSGMRKDPARAAMLFQRSCEGGNAFACADLGELYRPGTGVPRNLPRAVTLFQRACNEGACFSLGPAALEHACDAGSATACFRLARLYDRGSSQDGIPKDAPRAAALYKRACDAGEAEACFDLGFMDDLGSRVPEDRGVPAILAARGRTLYQQGCEGGDTDACYELGKRYAYGSPGTPKDAARAAALFRQACDGGHTSSCERLEPTSERKP